MELKSIIDSLPDTLDVGTFFLSSHLRHVLLRRGVEKRADRKINIFSIHEDSDS